MQNLAKDIFEKVLKEFQIICNPLEDGYTCPGVGCGIIGMMNPQTKMRCDPDGPFIEFF